MVSRFTKGPELPASLCILSKSSNIEIFSYNTSCISIINTLNKSLVFKLDWNITDLGVCGNDL